MIKPGRSHFVYWMFDTAGDCLYVGCTQNPEQRWQYHRSQRRDMTTQAASRRMAGPYTFEVARQIERAEQDRLHPRYNAPTWVPSAAPDYPLDKWSSVARVAIQVGIPKRTIIAAINRGDLPAQRPGDGATSAYIINQSDLDAWLTQRAQASA